MNISESSYNRIINKLRKQQLTLKEIVDICPITDGIYKKYKFNVVATCKQHGEFKISYRLLSNPNTKNRRMCPTCHSEKITNNRLRRFIKSAKKKYKNRFNYDKSFFSSLGENAQVTNIECKKHGLFNSNVRRHLDGIFAGCYACYREITKEKEKENFFIKSNKIHHGRYDYSVSKYEHSQKKIDILCPIHGIFQQYPINHTAGHGCKKCWMPQPINIRLTIEMKWNNNYEKLKRFIEKHNYYPNSNNDKQLSNWYKKQKGKYANTVKGKRWYTLSKEKKEKLEVLPGWAWYDIKA